MSKIFRTIKQWLESINQWLTPRFLPVYRLIDIIETENKEHELVIQVVHKNITFKIKPEQLLADDSIVDLFSPRDVRTLTYLGYLDIHSPKYKILAKRLTKNSHVAFALRRKTDQKVFLKTTVEMMQDEILHNLDVNDAQLVGFTAATESIALEKSRKFYSNQQN